VWSGVPATARQKFLQGVSSNLVQSATPVKEFLGAVSATNGTSYYTYPPDPLGAYPGSCWFFSADLPTGVMVQIQ